MRAYSEDGDQTVIERATRPSYSVAHNEPAVSLQLTADPEGQGLTRPRILLDLLRRPRIDLLGFPGNVVDLSIIVILLKVSRCYEPKGSRKSKCPVLAPRFWPYSVRPIERNRRRIWRYVEDFAIEDGPKMGCENEQLLLRGP